MRVGVFGGTFDPPHLAHLVVAETVREAFALERVLWIPNGHPPHKPADALTAPAHRLAMTRLATAGHDAFEVSTIEMAAGGPRYTVDTLRALRARHPANDLVLVVGGDSLAAFATWRAPEAILALAPLAVYLRPGEDPAVPPGLSPEAAARIRFVEAPLLGISSTALRARVRAGRSIRYLVPDAVAAYIRDEGLYR